LGERKSEREQAFLLRERERERERDYGWMDDYNEVGRQGCGEYIERRENGG
jgi:hypothetical protein